MMTHSQLKAFITESVLLLILGAAIVIGGYFISSDNANKRLQNEYHSRFSVVLESSVYEKVKSRALDDFPEIQGVYIGYDEFGAPVGYVIDITVESDSGQSLSMLVALDYESTRIKGIALNPAEDGAYTISEDQMELIRERMIGKQIPIAFVTEENIEIDENSESFTVKGLHEPLHRLCGDGDQKRRYHQS